jgi:hypothetical protein
MTSSAIRAIIEHPYRDSGKAQRVKTTVPGGADGAASARGRGCAEVAVPRATAVRLALIFQEKSSECIA